MMQEIEMKECWCVCVCGVCVCGVCVWCVCVCVCVLVVQLINIARYIAWQVDHALQQS